MFDFRKLILPIVQAPMAGGPSTPELAAAVGAAGGFGFLAGGYRSTKGLTTVIARTRALTDAAFGVNLFVPQPSVASSEALDAYRRELTSEAVRYGVALGTTHADDDDWEDKIDLLERTRPAVVSFTFGLPSPSTVARLHLVGITVVATVTTLAEAILAVDGGMDAVCAQGPAAGGHRATFDPAASPATESLGSLLQSILTHTRLPVLAAGGLSTRGEVQRMLDLGAVAAQLGTAFLRTPEAGTSGAHRAALGSPAFTDTIVTRAFSGRYARGLVNRFLREHDPTAPLGYPEVNQLTAPVRAAAAAAGDPHGISLWAGTGHSLARAESAGEVTRRLAP